MLLHLVFSNWQGQENHLLAHVVDTVALELGPLLPLIFSLQELFGLAIPKEPLAHARLVQTQVDARDCQNCEKFNLGFFPRKKLHWQWYFFWRCSTFLNHQIFPDCGLKMRKCYPPRIWCSATAKNNRCCFQITVFACSSS